MELKRLDVMAAAEEGVRTELRDPSTGKILRDEETGKPLAILTKGKDSKSWATAVKRHAAKYETVEVGTNEVNDFIREVLADCCIKLEGTFELNGETITPDNILKLYQHPGMVWIVEQLLRDASSRAKLFLKEPSGSKDM